MDRRLLLVFALYGLLAVGYSVLMPPWEAPDETAHYLVALHVGREGEMPTPEETYEAVQAPGYYWLAGLAIRAMDAVDPALNKPGRPPLTPASDLTRYDYTAGDYPMKWGALVLRWLNVGVGAVALAFIYKGARRLADRFVAADGALPAGVIPVATVGLVALTPMYLHNSASVSNDPLANAAGALLFWVLAVLVTSRPGVIALLLATVAALALPPLVKLNVLPLSLAVLPAVAWQLWHHSRRRWLWVVAGGAAVGAGVLAGLAWLAPTSAGFLWRTAVWRVTHVRPDLLHEEWPWWRMVTFFATSYWGQVGWKEAGLPGVVVTALAGVGLLGWFASLRLWLVRLSLRSFWRAVAPLFSLGLAAMLLLSRTDPWWRTPWTVLLAFWGVMAVAWWRTGRVDPAQWVDVPRPGWSFVWLAALLTWAIIVKNTLTTPQFQGRFFFPALGPIALLMVAGWVALLPPRGRRYLPHALVVGLVGLNLFFWWTTVLPVFYQPFLDG